MSTRSENTSQPPYIPEFLDVLDATGRPIGRIIERKKYSFQKDPLRPGDWYRVVLTCVFNTQAEMLIQQRSASRRIGANRWDFTAGGAVDAGETSQEAASRELHEEVGLTHDFAGQAPILTIADQPAFLDVYTADLEGDPSQVRLQAEEVQAARWATLADITAMITAGDFWAYPPSLIELIFTMHAKKDNWTGTN
ncbi:MAG: NUDIX domain-containing protein [Propionibacteriaceae bacterium]|nr:NUDIX domain-containing protein [Propionibacteriaceae bacterium]